MASADQNAMAASMLDVPVHYFAAIRIAIAADQRLSRDGLRRLLAADPAFEVVGGADRSAAGELACQTSADILLVEGRMPESLETCRKLARGGGRPWTILLAVDRDDDEWAVKALEAGVRGVLRQDACPEELAKAIRLVHEGQIWARRLVVTRMATELMALTLADHHRREQVARRLSPREQDVVRQATKGLSTKEIAACLGTSQATIKAHLTHIFQKLGVRDRIQLALQYRDA